MNFEREVTELWLEVGKRHKPPSNTSFIAYSRDLEAMARESAVAAVLLWLNVIAIRVSAEKGAQS